MNNNDDGTEKTTGGKKMIRRAINIDLATWEAARRKADLGSLSAIIRRLIRLWLTDRINLDNYEDTED